MTALDRLNVWLLSHFDKVCHALGGEFLAFVGALAGLVLKVVVHQATGHLLGWQFVFWCSVVPPVAIGAFKEGWDLYHPPHECSPTDFLAVILGALPIWIMFGVALLLLGAR